MGIGLGILLIVVGAILAWAVDINIPGVNDNVLGGILIVVGILAIVLALVQTEQYRHRRDTRVVDDRRSPPVA